MGTVEDGIEDQARKSFASRKNSFFRDMLHTGLFQSRKDTYMYMRRLAGLNMNDARFDITIIKYPYSILFYLFMFELIISVCLLVCWWHTFNILFEYITT